MKFNWKTQCSLSVECPVNGGTVEASISQLDDGSWDWWASGYPGIHKDTILRTADTLPEAMSAAETAMREFAAELQGEQEGVA